MTDTYLDGLLDDLVRVEPTMAWDDVLHRARRTRRLHAAVVLTVAMLVLASCSWVAVKAFEGTPAPAPVVRTFEFPSRVATEAERTLGNFPQADVAKAHGVLQVQTEDGPLDVWAAPATNGNTCYDVGWEADMTAKRQIAYTSGCGPLGPPHGPSIEPGTLYVYPHPYTVEFGSATGPVVTARVTLSSGRTVTLPVVEHFFLGVLPLGSVVASVNGLDASGKIVASSKGG
jgi:hypothetical protein